MADQARPIPSPFVEDTLKELWDQALRANNRYWLIRDCVARGDRRFPAPLGLKLSMAECSVDEDGRLHWRGRIWIPNHEPLRTRLIADCHESLLTGHPGRESYQGDPDTELYLDRYGPDVRRYVRNCDPCRRTTIWRDAQKGLLHPLPVPNRIWAEISADFITDLPPSGPRSATNLLVITDRLTKSVILEPMVEMTAEATAEALIWCLIRHHGPPRAIVSDRGTQFVNGMWRRICELMRITQRLSTAYHPETDGSTERMNQVAQQYLRTFVAYMQADWSLLLPIAMLAVNNRQARSTGMSPFYMTHGYHISPIELEADTQLRETGLSPSARGGSTGRPMDACHRIGYRCHGRCAGGTRTTGQRSPTARRPVCGGGPSVVVPQEHTDDPTLKETGLDMCQVYSAGGHRHPCSQARHTRRDPPSVPCVACSPSVYRPIPVSAPGRSRTTCRHRGVRKSTG